MTDGLYMGIPPVHGDVPMMVLDDLAEMFGLDQLSYMTMDGATDVTGGRARDSKGHSIRK